MKIYKLTTHTSDCGTRVDYAGSQKALKEIIKERLKDDETAEVMDIRIDAIKSKADMLWYLKCITPDYNNG
tara:strand:+ start:2779 stop:2991 length:213 start_codon:yes stop_codon:yes gene_type:complete